MCFNISPEGFQAFDSSPLLWAPGGQKGWLIWRLVENRSYCWSPNPRLRSRHVTSGRENEAVWLDNQCAGAHGVPDPMQ